MSESSATNNMFDCYVLFGGCSAYSLALGPVRRIAVELETFAEEPSREIPLIVIALVRISGGAT